MSFIKIGVVLGRRISNCEFKDKIGNNELWSVALRTRFESDSGVFWLCT